MAEALWGLIVFVPEYITSPGDEVLFLVHFPDYGISRNADKQADTCDHESRP